MIREGPSRDVLIPVLLFWAIVLPPGLALQVGTIVVPPFRIAVLLLVPFIVLKFMAVRPRFLAADYAIVAAGLFGLLAMMVTEGPAQGLEAGGSFAIDVLGSYFVGRLYVTDLVRFRRFLALALFPSAIVALIVFIESVSHTLLVAPLFPQRASEQLLYETRLGLLRGRATFPHSVAVGMFLTSLLPLYFFGVRNRVRKWSGTLVGAMAIFSVSSSAGLSLALFVILTGYKWTFNLVFGARERLRYLVIGLAVTFVFLDFVADAGAVRFFIRNFTLDPATGYYRLVIWEYGVRSVEANPLFGIGQAPMPRPSWMIRETIDNHWLLLAVRYGLFTALAFLFAVVAALYALASNSRWTNRVDRNAAIGMIFSLTAFVAAAWAGALWSNTQSWFCLMLGLSVAQASFFKLSTPNREVDLPALRPPAQPMQNA